MGARKTKKKELAQMRIGRMKVGKKNKKKELADMRIGRMKVGKKKKKMLAELNEITAKLTSLAESHSEDLRNTKLSDVRMLAQSEGYLDKLKMLFLNLALKIVQATA